MSRRDGAAGDAGATADTTTETSARDADAADGGDATADVAATDTRDDRASDGRGNDADAGSDTAPIPGTVLWARSAAAVTLTGVTEAANAVVVTGYMGAPSNLGGALLSPAGASDGVIARFATSDGAHLASSRFGGGSPGGTGEVIPFVDVPEMAGSVFVHGVSYCNPAGTPACNKIDVGLGFLDPGGGATADGFIGRYSASTGAATWVKRLVGAGDDKFAAVTAGPAGTIYAAGWFNQDTTLTGGADNRRLTAAGDRDVLITQLNATTGESLMTRTFAGAGFEQPDSIAFTGTHIIAAGTFAGTTVFGATTLRSASIDYDIWVAKVSATDGAPVWAVSFGGPGRDVYPHVVVDAVGDVYVTAAITGSVSFGTYVAGGSGGIDVVVAKLRNSDGGVAWARSFGSTGDDAAAHFAISPAGQLFIAATVAGPLQAGGSWAGGRDGAIVSYAADGTRLWSRIVGTAGDDDGTSVTAGPTGGAYATVTLGGDIGAVLDGAPIIGTPRPASVLLKLQP